jgi:hypothetical protein
LDGLWGFGVHWAFGEGSHPDPWVRKFAYLRHEFPESTIPVEGEV